MQYRSAILNKNDPEDWFVYFSYKHPDTGKLLPFKRRLDINKLKGKERLDYGQKLVASINKQLDSGWCPIPGVKQGNKKAKQTLSELLDEFVEIKKTTLRKSSYHHYSYAVTVFKEYLNSSGCQSIYPENFTSPMAHGFGDFILTEKKLGNRSFNNHTQAMRTYFNMMMERDIIVKNPFKTVKGKPTDIGKNIAFSDAQRKIVKEYLIEYHYNMYVVVQFVYYCFIRPHELMQLKVKHIDLNGKQIQIPADISKNRRQSSVEIPDVFFKLVKERYENKDAELFLFGRGLECNATPLHPNRVSDAHREALKYLKISSEHTLYSWKHTGAVAAIKSGMNPYSLMRQLRHHSLDQTMTYLKTLGLTSNAEFSEKQPEF